MEAVAASGSSSSSKVPSTAWLPITRMFGSSTIDAAARRTCASCSRFICSPHASFPIGGTADDPARLNMVPAPVPPERCQHTSTSLFGDHPREGRVLAQFQGYRPCRGERLGKSVDLSLIHISEPTRQAEISYAVFCLKKKKNKI